jgi:hypothetical protein
MIIAGAEVIALRHARTTAALNAQRKVMLNLGMQLVYLLLSCVGCTYLPNLSDNHPQPTRPKKDPALRIAMR